MPLIKPYKKERFTADYWNSEITQSEERRKKFVEWGQESIRVYNTTHDLHDVQRKLNAWWYCVNMLLPAYFSSTPKAEILLRKRSGGTIYELTSVILERNVQYAMDEMFDFQQIGIDAALQFLLTGQAVLWARYESEIMETEEQFAILQTAEGFIDGAGNAYIGEVVPGQDGQMYGQGLYKKKNNEKAILDLVQYNDYNCSDARTADEIEWQSRRAYLSDHEATELFGADVAKKLDYSSFPETSKREKKRDVQVYEGKAELHEIWCEETGKVYWLQPKGGNSFLESGDVPIKYNDFYPCSVIRSSVDPDTVIPTSDYVHCRDQIIEVERLTTRIHAVTQAIRTNSAYDASLGKDMEELIVGDLKMVPIKSWPSYKARGGLGAGIETLNIDPYIKALDVLTTKRTEALQGLYETLKVSDLLRGASDPTKTATANRLEAQWSSLGLIVRQNQFAKFIGKAVEKLGIIIASQFDPEHLMTIADADGYLAQLLPDPNSISQAKMQISEILKSETDVCYRIQIATDSLVALDERQERQDGADLMNSAGQFFSQMNQLIEQYPPLAQFAVHLFENMMRRYRGGKELEPLFSKAIMDIGTLAQQKMQQANQQPPDPTTVAAQAQIQVAQIQAQSTEARAQSELQKAQMDVQLRAQELQLEQQVKIKELEFEQKKIELEFMKLEHLQNQSMADATLRDKEINAKGASDIMKNDLQTKIADMQHFVNQQKLSIEKLTAQIHAMEKMNEERRLNQVELGSAKAANMPLPPIHINVDAKQSGKKRQKIIKNATGYDVLSEDI